MSPCIKLLLICLVLYKYMACFKATGTILWNVYQGIPSVFHTFFFKFLKRQSCLQAFEKGSHLKKMKLTPQQKKKSILTLLFPCLILQVVVKSCEFLFTNRRQIAVAIDSSVQQMYFHSISLTYAKHIEHTVVSILLSKRRPYQNFYTHI